MFCTLRTMLTADALPVRAVEAFLRIYREQFAELFADETALEVEALEPVSTEDSLVLVVITPWMITGLLFIPDDDFPDYLSIDARKVRVLVNEIEELGRYRSVSLVSDISTLTSQTHARRVGHESGVALVHAVEKAREPSSVTDPGRRAFFNALGLRSRGDGADSPVVGRE